MFARLIDFQDTNSYRRIESIDSFENGNLEEFNRSMIELSVNALAILALGITLKLLGKLVEDRP